MDGMVSLRCSPAISWLNSNLQPTCYVSDRGKDGCVRFALNCVCTQFPLTVAPEQCCDLGRLIQCYNSFAISVPGDFRWFYSKRCERSILLALLHAFCALAPYFVVNLRRGFICSSS